MSTRKKEEAIEAIAPDPVADTMKKGAAWVEANIKILAGGFAAILIGIFGVQYFTAQGERDASVVTTRLTNAMESYEEVTDPSKILSSTVAGALDGDLQSARDRFASISADHPGSGAGQLAKLYEADLARRLRKHEDAASLYEAYINAAKPDDILLFIALEGAGYAFEDQGKLDAALTYFTRIGTEPAAAFYKDYGLKHKARILEKKGDKEGAIEAYKAIAAMDPPSDLKSFADERLKLLQ